MRDLIIGIDVGTTTVKSAAFELPDLGAPIAVRKRPLVTASPHPDWSEVDPIAVEDAALATVHALVAELARAAWPRSGSVARRAELGSPMVPAPPSARPSSGMTVVLRASPEPGAATARWIASSR